MRSSQLHFNNFDRRSRPLIDQQCLTWPAATMAIKDFQVSVSWLFTVVANTLHGPEYSLMALPASELMFLRIRHAYL